LAFTNQNLTRFACTIIERNQGMSHGRHLMSLAGASIVALSAVGLAACGSGGGTAAQSPAYGGAASTTSPQSTPPTNSGKVSTASTSLGTVLVDSQGRTLYLFKADQGTKSACSGACATAWPPLRVSGKPTVGGGAAASKMGTTQRSDGQPEVTYNGHPLYTYTGDSKPGDVNGQGLTAFGAGWFALSPSGSASGAR
jgi:predicted lipoprotein with Yx(FWY)xxD motif